jgi:hypothetical protein
MRTVRSEREGLRQKHHKRMRSDAGSLNYPPKTIAAISCDGIIEASIDAHCLSGRKLVARLKPGSFEVITFLWCAAGRGQTTSLDWFHAGELSEMQRSRSHLVHPIGTRLAYGLKDLCPLQWPQ